MHSTVNLQVKQRGWHEPDIFHESAKKPHISKWTASQKLNNQHFLKTLNWQTKHW